MSIAGGFYGFLHDVAQRGFLRGVSPVPLILADIAGWSFEYAVVLVIVRREREISQPLTWVRLSY